MKTMQETFFAALDTKLAEIDLAAISQPRAANTGTVDIVRAGTFEVVVSFKYHFQDGHNFFESASPVWPEGGSNPCAYLAKTAKEVGRSLELITVFASRKSK